MEGNVLSMLKKVKKKLMSDLFFLIVLAVCFVINYRRKNPVYQYAVEKITENQLIEDCLQLKNLFKEYYAGYEYENNVSLNFEEKNQELIKRCLDKEKNGYISTDDFIEEIKNAYNNLKEGHFDCFKKEQDDSFRDISLFNHYDMYYSNIYFRKEGSIFFLQEINGVEITEMVPYIKQNENFELMYYPSKGNNIYRLGIFSQTEIKDVEIEINNQLIKSSLKLANQINYKYLYYPENYKRRVRINKRETSETVYYSCTTFEDKKRNYKILNDVNLDEKKNLILDLRGNPGGRPDNIAGFFAKILFNDCITKITFAFDLGLITSFNTLQKKRIANPYPKEKFSSDTNINIYMIVDSITCSCPEYIIRYLRKIENIHLTVIGQNTKGKLKGSASGYKKLQNSGLYIQVPRVYVPEVIEDEIKEGREEYGIFPDVWAIDNDVLDTLVLLTGDSELRNVLPFLDYQLE